MSEKKSRRKQKAHPSARETEASLRKTEQRIFPDPDPEAEADPDPKSLHEKTTTWPVVGLGASAGGLEAFTQLFEHLPENTGMAFVLVQHLAPTHESMLTELLSRVTKMPVKEVKDGMKAEANHVFVIPPNTNMAILHGVLHLMPRNLGYGQHMPIDYFFRSLAEDQKSRAIGVILSGTASDGALGLKAIKAEGGITFAQDEKTAKYDGMPRSAIAAGNVDFVLPPEKIAQELARIVRHPYLSQSKPEATGVLPESSDELNKILITIRSATSVDFSYYKLSTVKRRIVRRMILHKIEDLATYTKFLQGDHKEIEALYNDILINVTGFFRDADSFEALVQKALPAIMQNRPPDQPVRIWVPGCSTGEEAYSIAICLLEFLADKAASTPIQIFATDISEIAIERARAGIYLENIKQDVSQETLRRFFVKLESGYQISKTIRDMCVFAKQNVAKDPPFSKLDLISCRNLLIYLGPVLQKKVIPIFHYALKPSGFLLLGSSETIGRFSDLFALVDKKGKLYSKKMTVLKPAIEFAPSDYSSEIGKVGLHKKNTEGEWSGYDIEKEADQLVIHRYAPAGVIVNEDMEILQFRGRTGLYLEPAPGEASLNLIKMAREGLAFDLRTALHKARKNESAIRKENVEIRHGGEIKKINFEVIPLKKGNSKARYFLVLFVEVRPPAPPESRKRKTGEAKVEKTKQRFEATQLAHLNKELASTKDYMQSIIEEQEATNEELRSANEETQSSNEELQSTNEELETAKEELQSTNEELTTVNEELENRNMELTQANNDLTNLLSSVQIPVVMLGNDLRIRRFTPMAEKMLNVIPTDVGRKISDIKPNINISNLESLILEVIDNLTTKELEVQDHEGRWHLMRIRPYKTAENRIEGVILTLIDIDAQKREALMLLSNDFHQAISDTIRESFIFLDAHLRITKANHAFYKNFNVSMEETQGRLIYEIGDRQWDIPKLRQLLEEILPKNSFLMDFEVESNFSKVGYRKLLLNARQIHQENGNPRMILLAIEDVTFRERGDGHK